MCQPEKLSSSTFSIGRNEGHNNNLIDELLKHTYAVTLLLMIGLKKA